MTKRETLPTKEKESERRFNNLMEFLTQVNNTGSGMGNDEFLRDAQITKEMLGEAIDAIEKQKPQYAREMKVLRAYYGFTDEKVPTYKALGVSMQVSGTRIEQLKQKGDRLIKPIIRSRLRRGLLDSLNK